jgi:imidazolonepropionase-like amidohydrolase
VRPNFLSSLNCPSLSTREGLEFLDSYLMDRSFLSGYQLSPADFLAAKHVAEHDLENLANVKRWYTHVKAHASEAKSLENKELCKSDTGNKKTRKVSLALPT